MSLSIYYEAQRKKHVTEQEQLDIEEIVDRYHDEFPFDEELEDFWVYDVDSETDIIFSGSSKLPIEEEPQLFYDVANYWLKCLTEITNILTDSKWKVALEDVDLILDQEEGWRFPTEEEYNQEE